MEGITSIAGRAAALGHVVPRLALSVRAADSAARIDAPVRRTDLAAAAVLVDYRNNGQSVSSQLSIVCLVYIYIST